MYILDLYVIVGGILEGDFLEARSETIPLMAMGGRTTVSILSRSVFQKICILK